MNNILKNKKNIIFFAIIVPLLLAVNLFYYIALPKIIKINNYKAQIEDLFYQKTGSILTLGELKASFVWNLNAKVDCKNFKINQNNKDIIVGDNSYLQIALIPLLFKDVEITKIKIEKLNLLLTRNKEGKFNLETLFSKKQKNKKYKLKATSLDVITHNYHINFNDKFLEEPQNFVFEGEKLNLNRFNYKRHLNIATTGNVEYNNQKSDYDFNFVLNYQLNPKGSKEKVKIKYLTLIGETLNFEPGKLLPYINICLCGYIKDIKGITDLKFNIDTKRQKKIKLYGVLSNLKVINKNDKTLLSTDDNTHVFIDSKYDDVNLYIKKAFAQNDKINVLLSGDIHQYKTKKKQLNLKLNVDNSSISKVVKLFPKNIKVPLDPFNKLTKFNMNGTVNTKVNIKGYYKKPKIDGYTSFENLSLTADSANVENSFGYLIFKDYDININTSLMLDYDSYITVSGDINPSYQKALNLNITSSLLNLTKGHDLYLACSELFKFSPKPLDLMNFSGRGSVNVELSGKFKNINMIGDIKVQNGHLRYKGLAAKAYVPSAIIKFNDYKVIFDNLKGYVKNVETVVNGHITLKGFSDVTLDFDELNLELAREVIFTSPLLIDVQAALAEIKKTKGSAKATIKLVSDQDNKAKLNSSGSLDLRNATVQMQGFSVPFINGNGLLKYDYNKVYLEGVKANFGKTTCEVSGLIKTNKLSNSQYYDLLLKSNNVNLENVRKLIKNSKVLEETEKNIKNLLSIKGKAKAELKLKGDIKSNDILEYLVMDVNNIDFFFKDIGININKASGKFKVTKKKFNIMESQGIALNSKFKFSGTLIEKSKTEVIPDTRLVMENFDFSKLQDLKNVQLIYPEVKEYLSMFKNTRGNVYADMTFKPNNVFYFKFIPKNASAMLNNNLNLPLHTNKGKIYVSDKVIKFENSSFLLSKSKINVNGTIRNILIKPDLDLKISSALQSIDIDKYINPFLVQPINSKGTIPLSADIKGTVDNWNLSGQIIVNKYDDLFYQAKIALPKDKIRVLNINATGNKDNIDIQNFDIFVADEFKKNTSSKYAKSTDFTNINQYFIMNGKVTNTLTSPVFKNFQIKTPKEISVKFLNHSNIDKHSQFFTTANLIADVVLNGKYIAPEIRGGLYLKNAQLPAFDAIIKYANIEFNTDETFITKSEVNIAGSDLLLSAKINNVYEFPISIKELNITSKSINLDKILENYSKNPLFYESNKTPKSKYKLPAVVISNGKIFANDLIVSNLITSNFTSSFNFTPDWLLSFPNVNFNTAGGSVSSNVFYNIKNSKLFVNTKAQEIEANAASTTLLNLPNEVYGKLSGSAQFETFGNTMAELIKNSNGFANFEISKGRLVRLGSLEYLLRAFNLLKSGIGGLNLNNILDLIVPQKTGYFEQISGSILVKNGIISANEFITQGENLSLAISGTVNMANSQSNIKIGGKMSKKITGLLGPLGSISINTFTDFIPQLGFIPSSDDGFSAVLPILKKVPILGLEGGKYREFYVIIEGDLYDPSSVKKFKWVD